MTVPDYSSNFVAKHVFFFTWVVFYLSIFTFFFAAGVDFFKNVNFIILSQ